MLTKITIPAGTAAVTVRRIALVNEIDGNWRAEELCDGHRAPALAEGETVSHWCWGVYAQLADGTVIWLRDDETLSDAMAEAMILAGCLPVHGPLLAGAVRA